MPTDGRGAESGRPVSRPAEREALARCPICGGRAFGPGPGGRASPEGLPPRCAGCGSLERHRAQRSVFLALGPSICRDRRALQFSPDPAVEPGWFAAYELSVYGAEGGLDLCDIDRTDGAVDAVVCNHVLEHVPDDRRALGEIARILSPSGWLFLSVPDPIRVDGTREYGRARPDKHGHFRLYGPEVADMIGEEMPDFALLVVTAADPVTGALDRCHIALREADLAAAATQRLAPAVPEVELRPPLASADGAAAARRISRRSGRTG